MLTIFTIPKSFKGHIGIIQENAIASWTRLHPACEIILCGSDDGTETAAEKFKVKHIPDIARNEFGTPLLNSAFEKAQRAASYPVMCYINADIILLNDFMKAVQRVQFQRFLMVGQRWDINITKAWDFEDSDWDKKLSQYVKLEGELHPPSGSDYFVFVKGDTVGQLPAFAVGRPAWDNWFIYNARRNSVPVIDATKVTTVIHQNHDYNHVPNRREEAWEGPEADRNREIVGGWENIFTLLDATHVITPRHLLPALSYKHLRRARETSSVLASGSRSSARFLEAAKLRLKYWLSP